MASFNLMTCRIPTLEQEVNFRTRGIEKKPNEDARITETTTEEVQDVTWKLDKRAEPGLDEITNVAPQNLQSEGFI